MADSGIALAFIGTIVPDEPRFHGPAFNRAAQMFQREMVRGLAHAGVQPIAVYAIEPTPAFPHSRRMIVRGQRIDLGDGLELRLLPFVNIQPLKPLTVGLGLLIALAGWGWRHRGLRRIVHCMNLTMPPGWSVLLGARLIAAKATVSVMDIFRPGELVPNRLYWRVDYWLQRHLIPRFDGHAVVADAIAQDFAPGRRVCRIEGGIRPEDFAEPAGASAPPRDRAVMRVVLAGTLGPHNGVQLALDAWALLPPVGYELIIAGTGGLADLVRERMNGDPRIVYRGFLGFEEVLELYRSADILLNLRLTHALSTRYFFPSKMMECMASGTPVVSTCTGHVEEEFGDFVYLLREETPEALAELLGRLASLTPEERSTVGRRARTYVLAHKTWDKQGEKLARYFRSEVLANGPP
jgi:glycosyltransferase involved in cell wall biosynthesis